MLKILEKMEINNNYTGYLFDICITIWETVKKSSSVRITAFKIICEIVKRHPELKNEIEFLTQSIYTETLSPGLKHSFNRINKELKTVKI